MRLPTALLCLLSFAGCPGPADVAPHSTRVCRDWPLEYQGPLGAPIGATIENGVFFAPVTLGSQTHFALIDTGAPVTLVDASLFSTPPKPTQGPGPSFAFDDLSFNEPVVVPASLSIPLGGTIAPILVGGDLLCHFDVSFDAQGSRVFFGTPALPPTRVGPEHRIAMTIEGGGTMPLIGITTKNVDIPATRLLVQLNVEGQARTFMVDTGASATTLSNGLFAKLTTDGRATRNFKVTGVANSGTALITRAKSISIGDLEVKNVVVSSDVLSLIPTFSREIGHGIDGVLGATFLREFFVTVSYERSELTLRRYDTQSHWVDGYATMGFFVDSATSQVTIVQAGSDAQKKGLTVGTKVVSIDGQSVSDLPATALATLIMGQVGQTKTVRTESATFEILVEDMLGH